MIADEADDLGLVIGDDHDGNGGDDDDGDDDDDDHDDDDDENADDMVMSVRSVSMMTVLRGFVVKCCVLCHVFDVSPWAGWTWHGWGIWVNPGKVTMMLSTVTSRRTRQHGHRKAIP